MMTSLLGFAIRQAINEYEFDRMVRKRQAQRREDKYREQQRQAYAAGSIEGECKVIEEEQLLIEGK
jgi:hypothetical protein